MTTTTILRTASMPRVNLLPPEIAAERRARRMKAVLAAAVVTAMVGVGGAYLAAVHDVDAAGVELQTVQDKRQGLQDEVNALAAVGGTYADVTEAEALLTQARDREVRWSYYLNDLGVSIPDGVWLDTMSLTLNGVTPGAAAGATAPAPVTTDPAAVGATPGIGTITFTGSAYEHDDVANWLEMLSAQKGYADAYLTNSTERTEGKQTVVDFTSDVVVTDEALWHNYLSTAGE